ncbi:MAG: hypothetical protein OCD01_05850 [Fibrobacterales bacterium]
MILPECIDNTIIPFSDWPQRHLFTDALIPSHHRDLIQPLLKSHGDFVLKELATQGLLQSTPLSEIFSHYSMKSTQDSSSKSVGKWLFKRGIPFNLTVLVIWESGECALAPWKVVAHYHTLFFTQEERIYCIAESIDWGTIRYSPPIIECAYNTRYSLDK